MLEISNLHASVEGNEILQGLNLEVKPGEVHAIMGLNGSGKSTLSKVIAGRDEYEVTDGSVTFCGEDILEMDPEERAWAGIFLAFQYPVEIPGLKNIDFLKTALNSILKNRGEEEMSARDFLKLVRAKSKELGLGDDFLRRELNVGFSGGEKKRNEVLQLSVLNPKLAILDETDSGLDIDALRVVSEGVNRFRSEDNAVVVITHYQRLLNYIVPDYVHVMVDGKIVKSGDKTLAQRLDDEGYEQIVKEVRNG